NSTQTMGGGGLPASAARDDMTAYCRPDRVPGAATEEGPSVEARPSFNPKVPSIARTYDYLLGGKDHYPVDREIGEIFIRKFPGAVQIALDNRACLVRAVTLIAGELGISQFIDLGSGLPTADN